MPRPHAPGGAPGEAPSGGGAPERTPASPAPERPPRRLRWRDRDHTRGSLLVSLFVLALPLLATSLTGATFQLVDLTFVSRLGEAATTAVVVTNQSLRQAFFMLVIGASFGAQGLVARRVGEGRPEEAAHAAAQVYTMGLVASALVAALGASFPEPLLGGMQVSERVLEVGTPYVRLVFLLNFGFVLVFLSHAILHGAGDATTPLFATLLQAALAIAGEWCLVFGKAGLPALGVRGVALGIAVGQVAALALLARVLFGGGGRLRLRLRHFRPDPAVMARILALAWPPALQMLGGFLVTVFFIRFVGGFGEKAQAAYSIGLRLSMLGPMLAFPLAGACATLVGQSLGSGNVPRAWRALGVGLAVHLALLWSLAAGLALFRRAILTAFADDPEVIRIGSELLLFQAGIFAAWGFYFVFLRALQGAGDVLVPMALSLGVALAVTLPLGLWLGGEAGAGWGPRGVFAASLVGAAAVTLATGLWVATGRWTRAAYGRGG